MGERPPVAALASSLAPPPPPSPALLPLGPAVPSVPAAHQKVTNPKTINPHRGRRKHVGKVDVAALASGLVVLTSAPSVPAAQFAS